MSRRRSDNSNHVVWLVILSAMAFAGCADSSTESAGNGESDGVELDELKPTFGNRKDYNRKFAIIVGIDEYAGPNSGFRNLRTAVADAKAVASIMQDEFGYSPDHSKVFLNGEAGKLSIEGAIDEWLGDQSLSPVDSLLVFFAGHGFVVDGAGYLAAADSRKDDAKSCISVKSLLSSLSKLPRQMHRALIVDACFSGSLFREAGILATDRLVGTAMEDQKVISGDQFSYYVNQPAFVAIGSSGYSVAYGGDMTDRHSTFTSALLSVLRRRAGSPRANRAFTFRQLASQVEARVANVAGRIQIPEWGRITEGRGDFVFRPTRGRTVQIELSGPTGIRMSYLTEQMTFSNKVAPLPQRLTLDQGWLYRLRLDNIPNHIGKAIYPTIKVAAIDRHEDLIRNEAIPVMFSTKELELAIRGQSVRKVLFAPDFDNQGDSQESKEVRSYSSAELRAERDPLFSAGVEGTILAVVDIGNANAELEDKLRSVSKRRQPDQSKPTIARIPMEIFSPREEQRMRDERLGDEVATLGAKAMDLKDLERPTDAMEVYKEMREVVLTYEGVTNRVRQHLLRYASMELQGMVFELGNEKYRRLHQMASYLHLMRMPKRGDFVDVPLDEVLAFICEWSSIDVILLDEASLKKVMVSENTPVTATLALELTVGEYLEQVLRSIDPELTYRITPRGLEVTTFEADVASPTPINYPVIDLIDGADQIDGTRLTELIKRHVYPSSWSPKGAGVIEYFPERKMIVVEHAGTVHLAVQRYLRDLRRTGIWTE